MKVKRVVKKRLLSFLLCAAMVCGFIPQGETVTFAADNEVNLESDLKAAQITLEATDGNSYTMEELEANSDLKVAKGAGIVIELTFDTIRQVPEKATLVYELPEKLLDDSEADEDGILLKGTVDDDNDNAKTLAGNWTLDKNGKLTVTLDSEFYSAHKNDDDTVDLHGFYFKFTGNLSDAWDENNADLSFKGTSVTYTIPFEEEDASTEDVNTKEANTEEETAGSGNVKTAARVLRAAAATRDITEQLESVDLQFKVDGSYSTIDDLNQANKKVPKGAPVYFKLTFGTIEKVAQGATLTYQLPKDFLDASKATAGMLAGGPVSDSETLEKAATWTLNADGELAVKLDDDYYDRYKHDDNTVDLHGFFFEVWGSLSDKRGETSGGDDALLVFKDVSTQTTNNLIQYTIPFEYLNENAKVTVEKTSTFNAATRQITYTIKLTAPNTNKQNVTNIKVTDSFTSGDSYLSKKYQNANASKGSFSDGTWTIDEMEPNTTATLTYTADVNTKYFTDGSVAVISNEATASFNKDGKITATDTLSGAGTLLIKKSEPTSTSENGRTYLTYTLTVTAYGKNMDNVVVKDAFDHTDAISSYTSTPTGTITEGTDTVTGGKTMEWNVGTVKVGTPAILTYKVEVSGTAWDNYSSKEDNGALRLKLTNTAEVGVKNGSDYIKYDDDNAGAEMVKTLLTKTGSVDADGKGITYTVTVNKPNGGAMNSNISYIQDQLSAGEYTSDNVTVNVYNPDGTSEGTYQVPIGKIKNGDRSWKISLDKMPVSGSDTTVNVASTAANPYYYELSYTAYTFGYMSNTAGVGYGSGANSSYHTVTYGIGTTNFDYSKEATGFDIQKEVVDWKVTINSTIPADSGIEDRLNPDGTCGAQCGCSYYTKNQIDSLVIKQGDTTFVSGKDYSIIEYSRHSEDGVNSAGEKQYYGFKVKFLREITASASDPVTVQYQSTVGLEKLYDNHDGANWINRNVSKFCYKIGTPEETSEQERQDNVSYKPNGQDTEKKYVGYDEDKGEMVWYVKANIQSDISGNATITEYIPYGQKFSSANMIIATPAPYFAAVLNEVDVDKNGAESIVNVKSDIENSFFKDKLGNSQVGDYAYTGVSAAGARIDYENIDENGTYVDGQGRTCQLVTIPLTGLVGFNYFLEQGFIDLKGNNLNAPAGTGWNNWGRITIRVTTKLSSEDLRTIDSGGSKTYTNKVVFSAGDAYIRGNEQSADGTVGSIGDTLTKAEMLQVGPAYIEYSMDINPNNLDLMSGNDPLTVIDTMETGMSLATDHVISMSDETPRYFDVYDVSEMDDAVIYTTKDGKTVLDETSIRSNGKLLSANDYTLKDITGEELSGMASSDVGKPTYKITVPDGKHLVILYWVVVEGSEGDEIDTSNRISFFYQGELHTKTSGLVNSHVAVTAATSGLFTGAYFKLKKEGQFGEVLQGAEFTMYKYVEDGPDEVYMTVETNENGMAYFGHRVGDSSGEPIKKDKLYYIVETKAPEGYALDPTPYYFEFKTKGNDPLTVDGYVVHQLVSGGTVTMVNKATVDVPVSKIWDDANDQDGKRPDRITVNLLKDGKVVDSKTVTAADDWKCTFEGADKYDDDGEEIAYTVEEAEVNNYSTKITGSMEDGFVITNSYTPKASKDPTNPSDSSKTSKSSSSKSSSSKSSSGSTNTSEPVRVSESGSGTGDSTNIFLWMALIFVSGCGLVGIFAFKKRRTIK